MEQKVSKNNSITIGASFKKHLGLKPLEVGRTLCLIYLQKPNCEHGMWSVNSHRWTHGAWGLVKVNLLPATWRNQDQMPDMPFFFGFLWGSQCITGVCLSKDLFSLKGNNSLYLVLSSIGLFFYIYSIPKICLLAVFLEIPCSLAFSCSGVFFWLC